LFPSEYLPIAKLVNVHVKCDQQFV
jgi:hypothetical protein